MAWVQLTEEQMLLIVDRLAHIDTPEVTAVIAKMNARLKPADPVLDQDFLEAARKNHGSEGGLEFDYEAVVSYGDDDGAYVMGWKWIYFNELAPVSVS
jgi:hypothetical protein